MSFAELAERHDDFFAPTFRLRAGNAAAGFPDASTFTDEDGVVSGLRVETSLEGTSRFSFALNDVFDRERGENGRFDPELRETFSEGTDVEVGMGYGTGETTTLIRGRIESVKPNFPSQGGPSLAVDGRDFRYLLRKGTGTGRWEETDLETVVRDLIGETPFAGIAFDAGRVPITSLHHPETSDWEFLRTLAADNDAEFFSRAGTFHFRDRSRVQNRSPETTLRYGQALRSFTPGTATPRSGSSDSRATRSRVGTVKVRHNDEKNKEPIVGTGEVAGGGEKTRVETVPVRSEAEAERRAQSIARDIARSGEGGGRDGSGNRGETIGLPEIQVGRAVELTGLGAFSGTYHIESADHRLDESGYSTSFGVTEIIHD
jgi:phage protein D